MAGPLAHKACQPWHRVERAAGRQCADHSHFFAERRLTAARSGHATDALHDGRVEGADQQASLCEPRQLAAKEGKQHALAAIRVRAEDGDVDRILVHRAGQQPSSRGKIRWP